MSQQNVWRLIDTGEMSGKFNMDFDLKLLSAAEKGEIKPTLRFYRWEPATVSLGCTQKAEEEVNGDFCKKAGIDIVRRPSGGGAIFHEDEITYSFTAAIIEHPAFADLLGSYYAIIDGLLKGLQKLGIKVEVRAGKSSGPERYLPCFSLSSRHDLVVNGKKIIGSAQRRKKNAFLQHGSIPLSYNPELVSSVFLKPEGFFEKATSLSEILGHQPADSEVKNALIKGLEEVFEVKFISSSFSSSSNIHL